MTTDGTIRIVLPNHPWPAGRIRLLLSLFDLAVLYQLHTDHDPFASDIAYDFIFILQFL